MLRSWSRPRGQATGFECANQEAHKWLRLQKALSIISGLPTTGPWRLQLTPPKLTIRQASAFTILQLACPEFQKVWATWQSDYAQHTCGSKVWKKNWTNNDFQLDSLLARAAFFIGDAA